MHAAIPIRTYINVGGGGEEWDSVAAVSAEAVMEGIKEGDGEGMREGKGEGVPVWEQEQGQTSERSSPTFAVT